ncbi:MAG TPA: dihydrodipicolinate synthase family protein [Acidimicrobiia bacterium]|nr:dihydrodipicolinate synthase family protein [Acidimicrobiia bacterium]
MDDTSRRASSTFVISITPFTADGALDEAGLRAHLGRLAAAGIGVYLAGSGSGEGYTLDTGEVERVLAVGAEVLGGRVPVRAMGVEPRTAAQMVEMARVAARSGVEAMQLYSLDQGHGNRPTRAELDRYLRTVLDAATLPVVLSTHQSVGYLLAPDLIGALLDDYDQVIGVNCSTLDVSYLLRVIEAVDERADVHVGGPLHALTCLALGGQGYLSSDGNLAPRLCVSVIDAYRSGDLAACHAAFRTVMRLFAATRDAGGVAATKAALDLLGLPGGPPRPPRLPLDAPGRERVQRTIVEALALAEREHLT